MSVVGRGARRAEWEKQLERLAPIKKTLIRAQPYTCTNAQCFVDGRAGVNAFCPQCSGTGYVGVTPKPDNSHLLVAPAAKLLYFYADVQPGHGLYGSGGDFIRAFVDLGRMEVGDATAFCKIQEIDRATGSAFFPDVQKNVRPDYVRSTDGSIYTITQSLLVNFGDENLCRILTLQRGIQGHK